MVQRELRGTVVKKSRGLLDGANPYRRLHIRLRDGSTIKVRVNRTSWKMLQVGDSVVQRDGADPVQA
ncbi:DUF7489 domain-containing protein [Nocardia sp. CY41]|uniref:DUF7489 domain-containing protein n=1 Tax=Nocardia sp. CY41 TaxID=2608686 RepID=UPI00135C0326|nr:hypothetical protein [Nocardia sp. CY41]